VNNHFTIYAHAEDKKNENQNVDDAVVIDINDEGEKTNFSQELNFYIISVMVMYNHR